MDALPCLPLDQGLSGYMRASATAGAQAGGTSTNPSNNAWPPEKPTTSMASSGARPLRGECVELSPHPSRIHHVLLAGAPHLLTELHEPARTRTSSTPGRGDTATPA